MAEVKSAPVFRTSKELAEFASESLFQKGWYRQTFQLLERAGFPNLDHVGSRFYAKALWQKMQDSPVLRRMAKVAEQIMGTDLKEASSDSALQKIRTAGLVLRPGAEEAFAKEFRKMQRSAATFENREDLASQLTATICHSVIPGLVIKPGSVKEAVLWAQLHFEQVPWAHVQLAFGANTPAKEKALERAAEALSDALIPECKDGAFDRMARLRTVCKKLDLCQDDKMPGVLAAALRKVYGS